MLAGRRIGGDRSWRHSHYQLANLHGDTVATADSAGTIASFSETDEFGNQISFADGTIGAGRSRYNYLGSAQRPGNMVGEIMLMGARLFDALTGQFLSPDANLGGNETRYAYPEDPVNAFDPTGQWSVESLIHKVSAVVPDPRVGGLYMQGHDLGRNTIRGDAYQRCLFLWHARKRKPRRGRQ